MSAAPNRAAGAGAANRGGAVNRGSVGSANRSGGGARYGGGARHLPVEGEEAVGVEVVAVAGADNRPSQLHSPRGSNPRTSGLSAIVKELLKVRLTFSRSGNSDSPDLERRLRARFAPPTRDPPPGFPRRALFAWTTKYPHR